MVIISLLAGISLFALEGSRISARDAKRKADLELIAAGVELYKADCNFYPYADDTFPFPSPGQSLTDAQYIGQGPRCNDTATRTYIQAIPGDPKPNFIYIYDALGCSNLGGTFGNCPRFRIWARLESPNVTTPSQCPGASSKDCVVPCGGGSECKCNYCVTNP